MWHGLEVFLVNSPRLLSYLRVLWNEFKMGEESVCSDISADQLELGTVR